MSLQKLQGIISELQQHNGELIACSEDLRYRLSSEEASVSTLLLENDDLQKRVTSLEDALAEEQAGIRGREGAIIRILDDLQIHDDVLERVRYEVEEERQMIRERLARMEEERTLARDRVGRAEEELRARDLMIDELERELEGQTGLYQLEERVVQLEGRLVEADHVIDRQAAQLDQRAARDRNSREIEEMYNELVAKYNEQLLSNEELSDKLTATEFDLFATVEKLDLLKLDTPDSPSLSRKCNGASIGTMTEGPSDGAQSRRIAHELKSVLVQLEDSQYEVSELTFDKSALELRIEELETKVEEMELEITEYHALHENLEERRSENRDLSEQVSDLIELNTDLINRMDLYEDQMFELSEQISQMPAEGDQEEAPVRVIHRRLSCLLDGMKNRPGSPLGARGGTSSFRPSPSRSSRSSPAGRRDV